MDPNLRALLLLLAAACACFGSLTTASAGPIVENDPRLVDRQRIRSLTEEVAQLKVKLENAINRNAGTCDSSSSGGRTGASASSRWSRAAIQKLHDATPSRKRAIFDVVAPDVFASLTASEVENIGMIFAMAKNDEEQAKETAKRTKSNDIFDAFASRPDSRTGGSIPYNRLSGPNGRAGNAVSRVAAQLLTIPLTPGEKHLGMNEGTVAKVAERLDRWGVAIIPSVIAEAELRKAREWITQELLHPTYAFSSIYSSSAGHRYDYPLPISGEAERVMSGVLDAIGPVLSETLGEDAVLVEFSVMASFPGSPSQLPHSDTGFAAVADATHRALLYSCFIYLDDVGHEMAALDVWPGTNKLNHVSTEDRYVHWSQLPAVRVTVPGGSVAIMDSRTLHRGSGHTGSDKRPRFALYMTWLSRNGSVPLGSTWTIRSMYDDAVFLNQARKRTYGTRGSKGRFCWGGTNGKQLEDMMNHYPGVGLCTEFRYDPGRKYVVDALLAGKGHDGYLALWVDGEAVGIEPRYFLYEGGHISLGTPCHKKKRKKDNKERGTDRAGKSSDFGGAIHGALAVQFESLDLPKMGKSILDQWPKKHGKRLHEYFPASPDHPSVQVLLERHSAGYGQGAERGGPLDLDLWARDAKDVLLKSGNSSFEGEEKPLARVHPHGADEQVEMEKLSPYGENRHVWVRMVVTPSGLDQGRLNTMMSLGGDWSMIERKNSHSVKCTGLGLLLSWGAGRQEKSGFNAAESNQTDILNKLKADIGFNESRLEDVERVRKTPGRFT